MRPDGSRTATAALMYHPMTPLRAMAYGRAGDGTEARGKPDEMRARPEET
jgi:hypothetical protein